MRSIFAFALVGMFSLCVACGRTPASTAVSNDEQTQKPAVVSNTKSCVEQLVFTAVYKSGIDAQYRSSLGSNLLVEVSAKGCADYSFDAQLGSAAAVPFSISKAASLSYLVIAPGEISNRIVVRIYDKSAKLADTRFVSLPKITVAPTCTAQITTSPLVLQVDTNSNPLGTISANLKVEIAGGVAQKIMSVSPNNSTLGVTSALPTPVAVTHNLNLSLGAVGSRTLQIEVGSGAITGSCSVQVTVQSTTVAAPQITGLTTTPPEVLFSGITVGSSFVVKLQAQGTITEAYIGATSVSPSALANGGATVSVSANATGLQSLTARVKGPGGEKTQSLAYLVHPKCTLSAAPGTSAQVGENLMLNASIVGNYSNGTITSAVTQSNGFTVNASNTHSVTVVPTATGNIEFKATVNGPSGTQGLCYANINIGKPADCEDFSDTFATQNPRWRVERFQDSTASNSGMWRNGYVELLDGNHEKQVARLVLDGANPGPKWEADYSIEVPNNFDCGDNVDFIFLDDGSWSAYEHGSSTWYGIELDSYFNSGQDGFSFGKSGFGIVNGGSNHLDETSIPKVCGGGNQNVHVEYDNGDVRATVNGSYTISGTIPDNNLKPAAAINAWSGYSKQQVKIHSFSLKSTRAACL